MDLRLSIYIERDQLLAGPSGDGDVQICVRCNHPRYLVLADNKYREIVSSGTRLKKRKAMPVRVERFRRPRAMMPLLLSRGLSRGRILLGVDPLRAGEKKSADTDADEDGTHQNVTLAPPWRIRCP